MHARLLEGAEICAALGAVIWRTVWDKRVSDKPWLMPVAPDVAVPHFIYDKLQSVIFWRVVSDNGSDVVRHLEEHIPARNQIIHGVYQGSQSDLGEIVPDTDWPAEVRQLSTVTGNTLTLPDLPAGASTVQYVPNLRPNRIWRDLGPQAHPLGRSDFCGVEPLMDALDQVYSSWIRDVQLAVMRLIVPAEYLDNIGRGQGAVFEPDRRVFTPLSMLHSESGPPQITANQFKIRWQEHSETCNDLVNRIVQEAGYSPQTFGDYQGNAPTATEIEAREKTSNLTRGKKIRYQRPGLQDAIYSLMCVSRLYFGVTAIEPERPEAEFAQFAVPDEMLLAQTAAALAGAEAASKRTLVAMAHPEWSDDQVTAEVRQIIAETGLEMAGRARIALAMPPGETVYEAEQELATPVKAKLPPDADADSEQDDQETNPEGSAD